MAAAPAVAPAAVGTAVDRRAVAGWVLYDLANTVFSINILSNYFPLWVVDDEGGRDADFAIANSVAMALMFFSAPLIGALSDQARRRVPLLAGTTLVSCALTALLGTGGLATSLVIFVVANYFFQAGLIFYDALLPTVSTEENRGRIGGLGVGIGYVGSLIGVGVGLGVEAAGGEKPLIFKLTALLFAIFAIPCFLWVRERPRRDSTGLTREAALRAFAAVRQTLRRLRGYPDLRRFLIGRVFYADAANTLIAFMGIYATREIGFSDTQKDVLLLVGIVAAVPGGLLWGRVVDRLGPKRTLYRVLAVWAAVLALTSGIAFLDLPQALFWLVAPLAGIALGGTWAADRPFMLRLSPPRHLGQFYGLYAMAGRFAAIIGPLLWALIVNGLDLGRPAAVLSLLVMVAIAAVVLGPVADTRRTWTADELVPE